MRTSWLALVLAFGLVACSQGSSDHAEPAANTQETPAVETPAVETPAVETASVTFSGTLGCGHCDHQIGSGCSAAVKTADGTVYILDGVGAGQEAFDKRFDHGSIEVTGTVEVRDGVNFVTVASSQML